MYYLLGVAQGYSWLWVQLSFPAVVGKPHNTKNRTQDSLCKAGTPATQTDSSVLGNVFIMGCLLRAMLLGKKHGWMSVWQVPASTMPFTNLCKASALILSYILFPSFIHLTQHFQPTKASAF